MRREQRGDDLGVRRRAERDAGLAQLGVQLDRVDEVAVVRERDLAPVGAPDGLGVLPRVRAGRRVADVADRHVAAQRAQLLLVEDLVDEPLVAHRHDVAALGGGDARRLLPAVLERVEGEVGEAGDVEPGAWMPKTPHSSRGPSRRSNTERRSIARGSASCPRGHAAVESRRVRAADRRAGAAAAHGAGTARRPGSHAAVTLSCGHVRGDRRHGRHDPHHAGPPAHPGADRARGDAAQRAHARARARCTSAPTRC